jgi:hypothetical protein
MSANTVGQVYEYKVRMNSGTRKSEVTSSLVTITAQSDYSNCIQLNDSLDLMPLSYDFYNSGRTLYLD